MFKDNMFKDNMLKDKLLVTIFLALLVGVNIGYSLAVYANSGEVRMPYIILNVGLLIVLFSSGKNIFKLLAELTREK